MAGMRKREVPTPLHLGNCLHMTGGITYQIVIWYDGGRKHWRYKCEHPEDGAEHPTTCIERDYDGCAQTAARNHADAAHPHDQATIVVSGAGGASNPVAL